MSQALEEAVQEAQEHVQQQAVVNLDETSWHEVDAQLLAVGVQLSVRDCLSAVPDPRSGRRRAIVGRRFRWDCGFGSLQRIQLVGPSQKTSLLGHIQARYCGAGAASGGSKTIGGCCWFRVERFRLVASGSGSHPLPARFSSRHAADPPRNPLPAEHRYLCQTPANSQNLPKYLEGGAGTLDFCGPGRH